MKGYHYYLIYYATPGTVKSIMSNNVGKINIDKIVEAKKILDACSCSTFQLNAKMTAVDAVGIANKKTNSSASIPVMPKRCTAIKATIGVRKLFNIIFTINGFEKVNLTP